MKGIQVWVEGLSNNAPFRVEIIGKYNVIQGPLYQKKKNQTCMKVSFYNVISVFKPWLTRAGHGHKKVLKFYDVKCIRVNFARAARGYFVKLIFSDICPPVHVV